jgi:stage V sporulation protein B
MAGRGGIAVAFAKVYFILVGLVQQVLLPRVLGLDGYGAWSTVQSVASISYNPVTTTSIQAVSRAVAQAPDAEQPQAVRNTLKIHAALALPLAVIFFLTAGPIASLAKAPHVLTALRIVSALLLLYGLYTPLIGVVNGQKRFGYQAGLDMMSATLRTALMVAVGYWFATRYASGVEGAAWGVVLASVVTLLVAVAIVRTGKAGKGGPSVREHLLFLGPLFLGQVVFNLLLQADSLMLRRFSGEAAQSAGLAVHAADPLVGAYRATQLFSFLPYQLLIAVTFVLFPMLATAYRDADREAVARYVQTGVRLALILAGLMVSVTSGLSGPLLNLVFGAQAAELGARAMQVLTLGFGGFAIFGVLITVLNSLKEERTSAKITIAAFGLVGALGVVYVRGTRFGEELLWRMALSTSAGLLLATLLAAIAVKRAAGAVVSPMTLARVLVALVVSIGAAHLLPEPGKLMTLVFSALIALIYVAVLLILKELGHADLATVKAVVARRRR